MLTTYIFSILTPLVVVLVSFPDGAEWLLGHWQSEEYSHAVIIPFVGVYLMLMNPPERSQHIVTLRLRGGAMIVLAMFWLLLSYYGKMISLYGYALLFMIWGLFALIGGWFKFKKNWQAMALLIFVVPLPTVIFAGLSNYLQLESSRLGTWLIRLAGITVHLSGNVIDLGSMKLQVVEACAGLRYLFPMMAMAFTLAVLTIGSWWKKIVLFASAIPITILINSIRLALIAIFSEYAGIDTTTGFVHDFEGWVIFMLAFIMLIFLAWALYRLGGEKGGIRGMFDNKKIVVRGRINIDLEEFASAGTVRLSMVMIIMIFLAFIPKVFPKPYTVEVKRESFAAFPTHLGEWVGQRLKMEAIYENALPWNDYLLMEFVQARGARINLFIPYFDSFYKESYTHNPSVCLPGGGWKIEDESLKVIEDKRRTGHPRIEVNRLVTTIGGKTMLVYYWFQHKGRAINSQILVKPILMWNSIIAGRTDGALVRLIIDLSTVADIKTADALLGDMVLQLTMVLPRFVPD